MVLGGIAVFAFLILRRLPAFAPSYDISKIKKGFTKEQVVEQFGKPKDVTLGGLSPEVWVYTVPMTLYVSINFDEAGIVTSTYSHRSA